jgi:hypothetical protein
VVGASAAGSLAPALHRPPSSSWLNLVGRGFNGLTDRWLRRAAFHSTPDLIAAIGTWVTHWNTDPKPFVWHTETDKVIDKGRRGRKALLQGKAATDH